MSVVARRHCLVPQSPSSGEHHGRAEKHSAHSLSPGDQPAMVMDGERFSVLFVTASNMHGQAKIC